MQRPHLEGRDRQKNGPHQPGPRGRGARRRAGAEAAPASSGPRPTSYLGRQVALSRRPAGPSSGDLGRPAGRRLASEQLPGRPAKGRSGGRAPEAGPPGHVAGPPHVTPTRRAPPGFSFPLCRGCELASLGSSTGVSAESCGGARRLPRVASFGLREPWTREELAPAALLDGLVSRRDGRLTSWRNLGRKSNGSSSPCPVARPVPSVK